ncbi:MAG: hypothetical protein ABIG89_03365 [Candidatus Woesearchaeota archaeon]
MATIINMCRITLGIATIAIGIGSIIYSAYVDLLNNIAFAILVSIAGYWTINPKATAWLKR